MGEKERQEIDQLAENLKGICEALAELQRKIQEFLVKVKEGK
jgi:hypothetical protein